MDTLKAATELAESGFDEPQAKALARVLNEYAHENLATKQDIKDLRTETKQDFTQMQHAIDVLGKDLIIKLGGGLIVATGILLTAIRYLR